MEEECQTPFQGCEVILSLVESSVLVDRPFFNSLKQQGHEDQSFLSGIGNTKKRSFLSSLRGRAHCPAPSKCHRRARGGKKKSLYSVLRSSFQVQLQQREATMFQQGSAGCQGFPLALSPSVDDTLCYMYRESCQ